MFCFFFQHLSVTHAGVYLINAYCIRNICRALCYASGTRGAQNHVVVGYKGLVRGGGVYVELQTRAGPQVTGGGEGSGPTEDCMY